MIVIMINQLVLFWHQMPCSTRKKSRIGIQYPSLAIDPRRSLSACPHRQFETLPSLLDSQAALSNFYPNHCVQSREVVCTIFIMVFGMTCPGHEPATHRMRGGHANH